MPQSFTCLHYHIVFSTKHRERTITPEIRFRLHDYIGGVLKMRQSVLLEAGGVSNHVHLLIFLSKQIALSDALRDIKALSSRWIHLTFPKHHEFAWQVGYGAFAVSCSNLTNVKRYIANQEAYHRTKTFKDEFVELLKVHDIQYDEKYLWE